MWVKTKRWHFLEVLLLIAVIFWIPRAGLGQEIIAKWSFDDPIKQATVNNSGNITDYTPDEGFGTIYLAGNAQLFLVDNSYFASGVSGNPDKAVIAYRWTNGLFFKSWTVKVSTLDSYNIRISSTQKSSSQRGPRDFRLEYSANNIDWYLPENPNLTILDGDNWYGFDNLLLPNFCNNKPEVYIRWVMTSTTSVNGSLVTDVGTNRIDEIIITADNCIPPIVTILGPEEICSGEVLLLNLTSDQPGTTFTWTSRELTLVGVTGFEDGSGNQISQTLNNPSTDLALVQYSVVGSNNGCVSNVTNFTVIVKPKPELASTITPPPICSGGIFNYTPSSTISGTSFSWTRNNNLNILEPISNGTNIISEPLTLSTNQNTEVQYTYNLNYSGCTNQEQVTVEVKAIPAVPQVDDLIIEECAENPIQTLWAAATVEQGATLVWWDSPINGNIVTEPILNTIGTITYYAEALKDNCVSPQRVPVTLTINESFEINVSLPSENRLVCEGESTLFIADFENDGESTFFWFVDDEMVFNNGPTFDFFPTEDAVVYVQLQSDLECIIGSNPTTSNNVSVELNPSVTPLIAIADAPPAVCTGSVINLTANYINGGTSPTFQWFLNNTAIVGATSASLTDYTAFSAGTNIFKVVMTSNASCRTADEVEAEVEIVVNDEITPSLMISTPTTEICSGSEIAFSVDALFGGGLAPALQWRINGLDISGETGTNFLTNSLSDGDEVDCQLTSNDACATVSTVYSDTIAMQVTTSLSPNIVLSSDLSQNNICQNTQVHFTTTTTNGGLAPQYSWYVNGTLVPDSIAAGFIFNSEDPGNYSVAVSLNSSETCTTVNPVLSDEISFTVLPELPVDITITTSPSSACEGGSYTIQGNSLNAGSSPIYKFYNNGILVVTQASLSYSPQANVGDSWQVELTSNAICAVNNPNMSNTIEPDITPLPQAPAELTADRDNICANDDGTITLTATGGVGETLQWFRESCNGTLIGTGNNLEISSPETTTTYFARYQNSCGVSSCETVTVTVNESIIPQIAIEAPIDTPCDGDEVTLNTNVSGQGSNPDYSWTINGVPAGGNSPTLTASFNDGDAIVCTMLSSEACANPTAASDSYTMEMNPLLTPEISISADQTVVCEGTSILFTSTISNGGTNPAYQWNINNQFLGDENPSFEFNPAPGIYTINCLLTSSESCVTQANAISNEIIITVNAAVEPIVNVTLSQNQVCTGTEVSFTATAINGGDAPVFEWYRNNALIPGESNSFLNIIPVDGDAFYCVLQSNVLCANPATVQSETFTIEVVDNIVPDIVINTETTTVCNGSNVVFTSTIAGGGSDPAYSWFINNVLSGTEPELIYTPSDQDEVYCILLSSDDCANPQTANSAPIIMSVEPQLEAFITITADATEVCENTPVTFEAFAINEGDNPTYTWLIDDEPAGTATQLVQAFEAGTYIIRCEMTSDAFCVSNPNSSSNSIVLQVFATTVPSVSIEASQTNLCEGTEVQFIANVTGEGTNPAMEWYVNGAPQGMNGLTFAYIPTNGDEVWCELNSDAVCAAPQQVVSEVITLTVSNTITPVIQIETSQNAICAGTEISVAAYTSGGGINPSFQWFVNDQAVGENATNLYYTPNDNDFIYCVLTSSDACADPSSISSDTIEYTVSNPIILNEIQLNDASCNENNGSVTFIVAGGNGNPEYSIDGGNSWSNNPAFSNLAAGTFSYLLRDGELCVPIIGQFTIAQSGSPEIDQIITSNASNGLANGSATIMAIGNNLEYSLNNVDWQQDAVFSNLAEGGYPFVIRDANGCYIVSSFQILSDVVKLSLSDASGCKGNELTITISTEGIPTSKELLSHLNFNHLQLQFEEAISLHAEIPQNMLTADPAIPGNLFIHYVAGNNFTIPGAADLIELRFTALEEGNSSISWSGNSFIRMGNYEDRPIMTENASIAIDLGTDFSFDGTNQACQGDPISIGLIADGAYDALEWFNPSGELLTSGSTLLIPDANYSDGGLYSVILYSNGNCSREKSIEITIELCDFEPGIPNAFRPASFPPNNTFKPVFGPVIPESFEMMVFNSWGQQIFTTNDFSLGWDGTYKGQPQPQGNYVYVVRYNIAPTTLGSGLTKEVRGSVLLIR